MLNKATKYLPSKRWRFLSKIEDVQTTSSLINLRQGHHINFTKLHPKHCVHHNQVIPDIIQANLIHLLIKMTMPHQSGALFVGQQIFQNQGVCCQMFPLSLHLPLLHQILLLLQFMDSQDAEKLFVRECLLSRLICSLSHPLLLF